MENKDMTIQEMVDCLGQIFEQAWRDRSKEYDVVMVEAFNIWTLFHWDFNIEFPVDEALANPKPGKFDF